MRHSRIQVKNRYPLWLWVLIALLVTIGLVLGGLAVWANHTLNSRIAGVRDLEALGFECDSEFVATTFYQSECSALYYGGYRVGGDYEIGPGGGVSEPEVDWERILEPYPWIWHDIGDTDDQYLLHAGSKQSVSFPIFDAFSTTIKEGEGEYEGDIEDSYKLDGEGWVDWSYQFATGPLQIENEGDGWNLDGYLESQVFDDEGGFAGVLSSEQDAWLYAGPFSADVICENVVDHVPKRFVEDVTTSDELTEGQGLRAVIHVTADSYDDEDYVTHCFQLKYTLGTEETSWMKVVIPLDEFWQQLEERSQEAIGDYVDEAESDIDNLGFGLQEQETQEPSPSDSSPEPEPESEEPPLPEDLPELPEPEPDEPEDQDDEFKLFIRTFKDQSAKDAYFIANIDEHPCSSNSSSVIDSDLAVLYLPADREVDPAQTSGILDNIQRDLNSLHAEEVEDGEDEYQDESPLYIRQDCEDVITELERQVLNCQLLELREGICSGGSDDALLEIIQAVADDCQAMYDNASQNDVDPTADDLADCLQLVDGRRQDFIDSIQIVGDDHEDYGQLLRFTGYYRFDTGLPYVLWDDWSERTVAKIRFQFELVALHEYMHKIYAQELDLKERMRFHQEVLALYENKTKIFFDYLGEDDLSAEVQHRIGRHGSAFFAISGLGQLIEEVNGYAPQLIEALPEEIQEEYAEFFNDRHGIVAFVYALSETQIHLLYEQEGIFETDNILTGVEDFLKQGRLSQIAYEYRKSLEESEELDDFLPDDWFLHLASRIPISVRYRNDASLYGRYFDTSATDILDKIKDLQSKLAEEISDLEEQLLSSFRERLRAELAEEYGSSHKRVIAVLAEDAAGIFWHLVTALDPQIESEEELMDQVIAEIKSYLKEVDQEKLSRWEQNLAGTISDDDYQIFFEYTFFIRDLERQIFAKYGGIDFYLLYDVFSFSGLFAEGYPILALETPAQLSPWLEEHYGQHVDRESLAKYFKYSPQLELTSAIETEE